MNTKRVLIVDDEEPARMLLREMLSEEEDIEILGECADGLQAVKAVGELKPDLIFLDIQMPKLDGFEVLDLIDRDGVDVVFVTAYDEYALKAFEVNAVDYLLKPFSESRLKEALGRAREREQNEAAEETQPPSGLELKAASQPEGDKIDRVVVKDGTQIQIIPIDSIDFLMAQGDYVAIHVEKKSHLKMQTLQSLAASLDTTRFVRIHRSYVLNLDRLAKIETYAKDSRVAILRDGTELPISRSGYTRLKELLA
ncbi:MAG: response regulator [Candidatus Eisenbacteria bacterium]|uniref:Response regulator n=1 Tax=Eiseniibacteriota bacterium TaxID=2212470 RepID=A0A7Y2H1Y1_UNCEI|nr:response regulator [Candidatus Eisenbacteria bacterium]